MSPDAFWARLEAREQSARPVVEDAINDHDPDELYRWAELAQQKAEQAGLTITA